jgi:hypothetical protein
MAIILLKDKPVFIGKIGKKIWFFQKFVLSLYHQKIDYDNTINYSIFGSDSSLLMS